MDLHVEYKTITLSKKKNTRTSSGPRARWRVIRHDTKSTIRNGKTDKTSWELETSVFKRSS